MLKVSDIDKKLRSAGVDPLVVSSGSTGFHVTLRTMDEASAAERCLAGIADAFSARVVPSYEGSNTSVAWRVAFKVKP